MVEWEKTESGECKTMEQVPDGAKVLSINDVPVEEKCESCGKYILQGEYYEVDTEGCALCESCIKEFLKL